MWTGMKVFIELRDGVSLLIPFREASKVSMDMRYVTVSVLIQTNE